MRFAHFAVVLSLSLASSAFAQSEAVVDLRVGDHRTFTMPGVTRVAVGDSEIADAKVSSDGSIEVVANGTGKTTLLIWAGEKRRAYLLSVHGALSAPTANATALSAPVEPANETLSLKSGESRTLGIRGVQRLAIGDPTIAEVKATSNDEISLKALNRGETTLLVWREGQPRYTIRLEVR